MKYLIIAFMLIATPGFAQKKKPVAKPATTKSTPVKKATEWDELDKTFVAFIKSLENKDKMTFDNIALVKVDCAECPGSGEQGDITHYVPSDVFYITVAEDFKLSPVYKALINRGYAFNSMVLKGFKPSFIKDGSDSKDLKVYEVWVPTYKPDELSKGHPGSSHAFQFVKVHGEFRFFGLTSQTL